MLGLAHRQELLFAASCAAVILVAGAVVAYAPAKSIIVFVGGTIMVLAGALGMWRLASLTLSFALVGAVIIALPANGIRPIPGASLADLLLVVAAVTTVLGAVAKPNLLPKVPAWVLVGAGCLLVAACVAQSYQPLHRPISPVFMSKNLATGVQDAGTNLGNASQLMFAAIVLPVVVAATATSWNRVRLLATIWTIGATASAAVALLAAFTAIDLQETITGGSYSIEGGFGEAGRFTGLTVHPTTLGLASAMAVPIVLSRIRHPDRTISLLSLAAGVVLVLAILVSGTRAGVLALVVGFIYMFAVQSQIRRTLLALLVLGAVVGVVRASSLTQLSIVERFTGSTSGRSSTADHSATVSDAIALWEKAPLTGWGFDAMRGAHNIVLQMLVAGGPAALAGFLALAGGAWFTAASLRKAPDVPDDVQQLTTAFAASLLIWLAAAVVQSTSSDRYLYLPVAMILAVLFARQRVAGSGTASG